MRYFELTDDVHVPNRWYPGEVTGVHGDTPRLRVGLPFSGGTLRARVYRSGDPLPFSLSGFAVPIVHAAVAEAIQRVANADVQRIPVEIEGADAFEVLNVVRVVRCLDERRSQFLKWTASDHRADLAGQYRGVTRLRLDPHAIPADAHVFRVKDWAIAMIVSQHVKDAMEAVGCLGATFVDVTGDVDDLGHLVSAPRGGGAR